MPGDDATPFAFRQPIALRAALRRWRDLIGMTAGVAVALGIVMLMLALSDGTYRLVVGDYLAVGFDAYAVEQGGALLPILPGEESGTIREARRVLGRVRAEPGVRAALGVSTRSVERTVAGPRARAVPEPVALVGVDGQAERVPGAVVLRRGRWLEAPGEAVLGGRLAAEKGLGVGDALVLQGRRLRVVGVGRLRGVGVSSFFSTGLAYTDRATLSELTPLDDTIDLLLVDADDPSTIRARLLAAVDGVEVTDVPGVLAELDQLAEHDIVFMRAGAVLALVIAAVFVGSMLARAVAEQRAEIATLRAIGMTGRGVVGMVLVEALVVAGAGVPLGALLGHALGLAANLSYARWLDAEALYSPAPGLFALTGAVALVLAVGAALLPARAALRVEPADALRGA